MAKQRGIIKLEGTMGDITFYRTRQGYIAREKMRVAPGRVHTDPRYERTRENMDEFGRASKAAKVLRNSVGTLLRPFSARNLHDRLTREMLKVIRLDTVNPRGLRRVTDGEAKLLHGFDFNAESPLESGFKAPLTLTIDRMSGDAGISIDSFNPKEVVTAGPGATHYKLVSAAMDIDFESEEAVSVFSETAILKILSEPAAITDLQNALPPASGNPLFLVFGISFYQLVNGRFYPLLNGTYNALRIVRVSGTPREESTGT